MLLFLFLASGSPAQIVRSSWSDGQTCSASLNLNNVVASEVPGRARNASVFLSGCGQRSCLPMKSDGLQMIISHKVHRSRRVDTLLLCD